MIFFKDQPINQPTRGDEKKRSYWIGFSILWFSDDDRKEKKLDWVSGKPSLYIVGSIDLTTI